MKRLVHDAYNRPLMALGAKLSVIIPVYRSDATVSRVLAALRPQLGPRTEVVVIDSSSIKHAAQLERDQPWLRVIGLPERRLPGEARNSGVRAASRPDLREARVPQLMGI